MVLGVHPMVWAKFLFDDNVYENRFFCILPIWIINDENNCLNKGKDWRSIEDNKQWCIIIIIIRNGITTHIGMLWYAVHELMSKWMLIQCTKSMVSNTSIDNFRRISILISAAICFYDYIFPPFFTLLIIKAQKKFTY